MFALDTEILTFRSLVEVTCNWEATLGAFRLYWYLHMVLNELLVDKLSSKYSSTSWHENAQKEVKDIGFLDIHHSSYGFSFEAFNRNCCCNLSWLVYICQRVPHLIIQGKEYMIIVILALSHWKECMPPSNL